VRIDQRIPDLSDKELENLHANAVRLGQSGTPAQRQHAEELLPLLGAALEERRRARAATSVRARRSTAQNAAAAGAGLKMKSKESD
jgi:hypothetical protein